MTQLDRRTGPAEAASLVCSTCGYGIVRTTPPEQCPMCRSADAWARSHRPPFGHRPETVELAAVHTVPRHVI